MLARCRWRWLVMFTLAEKYVVLILAHRLRRWPNIKTISVQRLLFVGSSAVCTSVLLRNRPPVVFYHTLYPLVYTNVDLHWIHGVSWWIFIFNQSSPPAALSANDAMLLNIALERWRKSSKRSLFKAMKGWGGVSHFFTFFSRVYRLWTIGDIDWPERLHYK